VDILLWHPAVVKFFESGCEQELKSIAGGLNKKSVRAARLVTQGDPRGSLNPGD